MAFNESTPQSSTDLMQHISDYIDQLITQRLNFNSDCDHNDPSLNCTQMDIECAVTDSHDLIIKQYLTVDIRINSTHSVGFQSYWLQKSTGQVIKRQIQNIFTKFYSVCFVVQI